MSPLVPKSIDNRLLGALPRQTRLRMLRGCEPVELVFGEILSEPGERIRYVHFPTKGFISLVAVVDGKASLEVGLIGNEGMLGVSVALGVDTSPMRAMVQGSGGALRMPAAAFRVELREDPALRRIMDRYIYVLLAQLAQTAACTCFHVLEARLARWLLMTHDRAHADHFYLTHELLSRMLGVRAAASPVPRARCNTRSSSITAAARSRCSTAAAWSGSPAGATRR